MYLFFEEEDLINCNESINVLHENILKDAITNFRNRVKENKLRRSTSMEYGKKTMAQHKRFNSDFIIPSDVNYYIIEIERACKLAKLLRLDKINQINKICIREKNRFSSLIKDHKYIKEQEDLFRLAIKKLEELQKKYS